MSEITMATPAKLEPSPLQKKLLELRGSIDVERQVSWLSLGAAKGKTVKMLTDVYLSAQSLLVDYEKMDVLQLQKAIEDYKATIKRIEEIRKGFTKYMDKIKEEMMQTEKTAAAWNTYEKAAARFLTLREEQETIDTTIKTKADEATEFRLHVNNELIRIKTNYEIDLNKAITDAYTQALNDDLTEDGLKQYVAVTEAAMKEIKRIAPEKFPYKIHTKEEVIAIASTIQSPDWNGLILAPAIQRMKDQFNLYYQDRANKEKATDFLKSQMKAEEAKLTKDAETAKSVNVLAAVGQSISSFVSIPEVKGVVRKKVIVVKDDDPSWAVKVMSEFLKRFEQLRGGLRVTKWSNLTIRQMATALDDAKIVVEGLDYTEIKK